jgi:hypothetical protein
MSSLQSENNNSSSDPRAILRAKLKEKIQQKKMSRINKVSKQKKVDNYCKKMGIKQEDMEIIRKNMEKFLPKKN